MPTLTLEISFSASHHYHVAAWSAAQNQAAFCGCANRNGHGHDYQMAVTLSGPVDPATGMLMNFCDLAPLLQAAILDVLDHKHLNLDVPHFETTLPTLENIVVFIWNRLAPVLAEQGHTLARLHLSENPMLSVEYDGVQAA